MKFKKNPDSENKNWEIIHSPSGFILRSYVDKRKADQMLIYLDHLLPNENKLFNDDDYLVMYHLLFEKIFVNFFVSGLRSKTEMLGFVYHNQSMCVTADISEESIKYLINLAIDPNYTGNIFVDSGAFKEVNDDLSVKKAMTHEDWIKIFDVYDRLGKVWKDRIILMAPDRVGDQEVTMERLERYSKELQNLAKYGCKIMGAIQKNPTIPNSLFHFHTRMNNFFKSIGIKDWVRGLPLNKSPVRLDDVIYMIENSEPFKYMHFLGKSPYAKDWEDWEKGLAKYTHLDITCDATIFRRMVGEGKPLTEMERQIKDLFSGNYKELSDAVFNELRLEIDDGDYSEFYPKLDWFEHFEIKEALADTIANAKNNLDIPKEWLLIKNNLTRIAFLDLKLNLPYDLLDYVNQTNITTTKLQIESMGDLWELKYDNPILYWDTIMELYIAYMDSNDFKLPYETFGTYFDGRHDGHSLFGNDYRQAVQLDKILSLVATQHGSKRTIAIKLLDKKERGYKTGRLVVNRGKRIKK